ncbi:MAG: 30S ribosomal protein S20 [candidate division WOR-3 bacterium]
MLAKKSISSIKRERQNQRRRIRNRSRRAALKTALKRIQTVKSKAEADKLLDEVQSTIDRSARHHIIHRNTASRLKARLAREVAQLR